MRLGSAMVLVLVFGAAAVPAVAQPDLTGIWAAPFRVHSSGFPLGSGETPWLPASAGDVHDYHILTLDEASAIVDRSVAEHHGAPMFGFPQPPPPKLTPLGRDVLSKIDLKAQENRAMACYPSNVLDRIGGGPVEIVQNPKAIAFMYEGGTPGRSVFMDGRSQADAIPQWNGLSVGRWVGNTLKIVTVAIRGEFFGFRPPQLPLPLDENAKLTEEYMLQPDGQHLDMLATFEDPTLYAEPLHKLVHLSRTTEMVTDYTCTEGKEDMVEMSAKPVDGPDTDLPSGPPPGGPSGPPPAESPPGLLPAGAPHPTGR